MWEAWNLEIYLTKHLGIKNLSVEVPSSRWDCGYWYSATGDLGDLLPKTGKLHRNLPTQQLLSRLRVQRSQLILFWDVRERKSKSTPTKNEHCERIMSYDCPLSKAFKTLYFLLAGMDSHEHWHHSESRFAIVIFKFSSFGKDISYPFPNVAKLWHLPETIRVYPLWSLDA